MTGKVCSFYKNEHKQNKIIGKSIKKMLTIKNYLANLDPKKLESKIISKNQGF